MLLVSLQDHDLQNLRGFFFSCKLSQFVLGWCWNKEGNTILTVVRSSAQFQSVSCIGWEFRETRTKQKKEITCQDFNYPWKGSLDNQATNPSFQYLISQLFLQPSLILHGSVCTLLFAATLVSNPVAFPECEFLLFDRCALLPFYSKTLQSVPPQPLDLVQISRSNG